MHVRAQAAVLLVGFSLLAFHLVDINKNQGVGLAM